MIVLVRIDDRLVHGQVIEGWMPALDAAGLLVVSDQAAADPTQKALMELALPEGVKLVLTTIAVSPDGSLTTDCVVLGSAVLTACATAAC